MTDIHLYNTRTRSKELFRPIDPKNVRMYVCGPTVYDRAHIGNARPVVVFDVLFRLLRHVYGEDAVTYARNFTDVDDRIINRAVETKGDGEMLEAACRRITDETIAWYHQDMGALGALRPTHEPRCTEYIPQMVAMTETLIGQGHAYEAEGHVLFAVESYGRYGALARRSLDDMVAGSRVEVAPYKKNPMDFVLWKPSTPEQPGWKGPKVNGKSIGRGRPGWHIECSAMAQALLGDVFDIHGGGIDLQFPHHENEVAQSCCANHTEVMANVWMHNGFLQVEGEKMAKSAGNFFTVKDLLDRKILGSVIRFVLLSRHYREPLGWTPKAVDEARKTLTKWGDIVGGEPAGTVPQEVIDALADDLNTPSAIAVLHKLAKQGRGSELRAATQFLQLGLIFEVKMQVAALALKGLDANVTVSKSTDMLAETTNAMDERRGGLSLEQVKMIEKLLIGRQTARANKDFNLADKIRDDLAAAGVEIMDTPEGTSFKKKFDFNPAKLEALE